MDPLPASLLPTDARTATVASTAAPAPLHPEESRIIARAVPKRRREFARGRAAARAALEALGLPPGPIPVGSHREPLWPVGVVGSISHCDSLAWAAVAPVKRIEALGIDVEAGRSLPPEVRERVLTDAEAQELRTHTGLDTVGFGAKECIHKAIHPRTGVWLDFTDVVVEPVPGGTGLRVRLLRSDLPSPARRLLERLEIRFGIQDGLVYTAAWAASET